MLSASAFLSPAFESEAFEESEILVDDYDVKGENAGVVTAFVTIRRLTLGLCSALNIS